MRVSNQTTNLMATSYLMAHQEALYRLQEQISSGKKVLRASDDPGAFEMISRFRDTEARLNQFVKNADRLTHDLTLTDQRLQEVSQLQQRISEIIVSASDGTKRPEDREVMGTEVNQMLEDLLIKANSATEGHYLFAGLRTDTPPYTATRNASGMITGVTYNGTAGTHMVEIDDGVYIPENIAGSSTTSSQAAFQTSECDLFANLIHVRDILAAGENPVADMEFTAAPAPANTLTMTHGTYATGSTIRLSSTDTLPGGLSANTPYYVIRVSATQIQLATSLANARLGVAIPIADAGVGTHTLTQQTLADNTRNMDHIGELLSQVGAYEERVALHMKTLNTGLANTLSNLDSEEALDVAIAVTQLSAKKTAYEGALKATIATMNMSLLDYL